MNSVSLRRSNHLSVKQARLSCPYFMKKAGCNSDYGLESNQISYIKTETDHKANVEMHDLEPQMIRWNLLLIGMLQVYR